MTIYNSKPKPRALFIGFEENDLKSAGILELFPTYRLVDEVDDLRSIRQTEFEVVIAYDEHDLTSIDEHLFVVSLGGEDLGTRSGGDKSKEFHLQYHSSVATEFIIDEGLDDQLKQMVSRTLLPIYQAEESHHELTARVLQSMGNMGRHYLPAKLWSPLLSDADGKVLAGYTARSESAGTELWYFHPDLSRANLKQWIELLTERWALINPAGFPNAGNWKTDPKWQSAEEVAATSEINDLKADFVAKTKAYEASLATLEEKMQTATKNAEVAARVLLTSQGDTLKDAVKLTLEELGFTVTDVDAEIDDKGTKSDKLEDLRATTSLEDKSSWLSLIEVRGYIKGAKVNDLLRLGRFTKRYMQESGGIPPNAVWYIVNHDFKENPDNRQQALKESPSEVKEFGNDQGLVIDTVELFKLKRAVEDGAITKEAARTMLMTASGSFKLSVKKSAQAKTD